MTKAHKNSSGFRSVLANTSFRFLWFGQICSQLAVNTMLFVLALRVYHLTASNTAVSGLFLVYGIPSVLFGLVAGTIVDKFDSRRVLMTCDISRAVLILFLLFFSNNIFSIYILAFLNSVITQFYVPAEAPTIPRLVGTKDLVTANSLFSFTFYSSLAMGSIGAGTLLRFFGWNGVFYLISILFLIAAFFVSRISWTFDPEKTLRRFMKYKVSLLFSRVWVNAREGYSYITTSVKLLDALLLLTGTQIILALLATLGPGFADRVLEIDIRDSSLIIVGPAVLGIVLGALWVGGVGGRRISANILIERGILGAGLVLMAVAVTVKLNSFESFAWVFQKSVILPIEFTLFFLLGLFNSMLDVPANSILQQEAEGEMRGRVYGMLTTAVGGVGMLPVILGGVFADTIGVGKVIFILGVSITLFGLLRIRYNRMS